MRIMQPLKIILLTLIISSSVFAQHIRWRQIAGVRLSSTQDTVYIASPTDSTYSTFYLHKYISVTGVDSARDPNKQIIGKFYTDPNGVIIRSDVGGTASYQPILFYAYNGLKMKILDDTLVVMDKLKIGSDLISKKIIPLASNTYDIGESTKRIKDVYLAGFIKGGTWKGNIVDTSKIAYKADSLGNQSASYYLNSSNQNTGTLPVDRLSGTYHITADSANALVGSEAASTTVITNLRWNGTTLERKARILSVDANGVLTIGFESVWTAVP